MHEPRPTRARLARDLVVLLVLLVCARAVEALEVWPPATVPVESQVVK